MRSLCVATGMLLLLTVLSSTTPADEVILKDGRKFTGEIVKESDDEVRIKTVGGTLTFPKVQVLQIAWKEDPKKIYRQKSEALRTKAINARMELARWCKARGLEEEARRELEQVLLIDPENFDAQSMLGRIAKTADAGAPPRVEVTLTDNSQVKGRLVNPLFTLDTPYGLLHIPSKTVKSIVMGEDKASDVVETQTFKAKGELAEELFVIDSKLGRLTIARKDVRDLAVYQPTPEELTEYDFNNSMREINHFGLDVMLVIDSTDSMVGVLRHLRDQSEQLCGVVRGFVPNTYFGLVCFRDHKKYDPGEFEYVTRLFPVTDKVEEFRQQLAMIRASGGGDIPEAVFDGLSEAMTRGGWRPQSHRIIILIGDAPPHPEDNGEKKTVTLVTDWRKNTQGTVHVIDTTGYNRMMYQFRDIAEAGGGMPVILNDEKQIVREIIPLILGVKWRDRFLKVLDQPAAPPAEGAGPDDAAIKG